MAYQNLDNDDLEHDPTPPVLVSAARFVASVTAELTRDGGVYNSKNVTFIEAMGRDMAGSRPLVRWRKILELRRILCSCPEIPLDEHALCCY